MTQIYLIQDNLCERNYKISEKEKQIDVSKYKKTIGEPIIISENDTVVESYYNRNNQTNNQIVRYSYSKKNKVRRILSYDLKTGTIKSESYTLNNSDVGIFRTYDKKGNVIDSIEFSSSENYKICHIEALEIVKKKSKPKKEYDTGDFLINRLEPYAYPKEYLYKWSVIIHPKKTNKEWLPPLEYIVDAMTGKIITIRKKNRR